MVIDMPYCKKVAKRLALLILSIIGLFLSFKLAIFYMPFLIALIISMFIEPIIKLLMKKAKLTRRISSIIVLSFFVMLIAGLLVWGITALISESSNLLSGLNDSIEKIYTKIQEILNNIDLSKLKISNQVTGIIQNSSYDFLNMLSNWIKQILTSLLNIVTSIPKLAIYVGITAISLYFICVDKIYILDQVEHHMPKAWVKKMGSHIRELIQTLGGYLKAQIILIFISFIIVLCGLFLLNILGLNVKYPLLAAIGIAFVDALPILGSGTVIIPWAVISACNGEITLAISLIVLLVIIMVTRQMIEPKIVSSHIGIHPIFTIISMYTGFKFIGVIGMFLGPIVLIILKNIYGTIIDRGILKSIFDR